MSRKKTVRRTENTGKGLTCIRPSPTMFIWARLSVSFQSGREHLAAWILSSLPDFILCSPDNVVLRNNLQRTKLNGLMSLTLCFLHSTFFQIIRQLYLSSSVCCEVTQIHQGYRMK